MVEKCFSWKIFTLNETPSASPSLSPRSTPVRPCKIPKESRFDEKAVSSHQSADTLRCSFRRGETVFTVGSPACLNHLPHWTQPDEQNWQEEI